MLRRLLFLILLAGLLLPHGLYAQGGGTIEGTVTVGAGEALPEGLEVELLFLPNGAGPPRITNQPLPPDGTFRFAAVDPAPEHRYLVRVKVEGEDNLSNLIAFQLGETSQQVTLELGARTTDASTLTLPQASLLMNPSAGGWLVVGLYSYANSGERIIENLTDPPATVPLPAEATDIQFPQDVDFSKLSPLPAGFAYAGPFPPGTSTFAFSFVLPYREGEQTLTLPLAPGAGEARVLVADLGQRTTVEGLTAEGTQTFEGQTYNLFLSATPGDAVTLRFTGLPAAPTPPPSTEANGAAAPRTVPISPLERLPWWVPLLPLAVVLLGVGTYLAARPTPSPAEERATLRQRRDTLLAEIAALDMRHEMGSIGEGTHRRQRTLLKREAREVLQRLGTDNGERRA